MHISFVELLLLITLVASALMAGLFFAYACSVNPGLGRLADRGYLSAMQSINRAILNPVFFAPFMGSLVLLPLATWAAWSSGGGWLLAATGMYFAGVFGVTIAGNVPLNNALDKLELQAASEEQLAQYRANFEKRWNRLNLVRTVCAVLTLALVGTACICQD
ncbi:anthrone oxygenase family protein [Chitinophaga arvensicola]|nr:anthrone oxygenase family protein [Chitinophaga arvensicola]